MADIEFEKRGALATITFNRPEAKNTLTAESFVLLSEAWDEFSADRALRVAILTGRGDEAFCAGGDLKSFIPLVTGVRAPETDLERRFLEGREYSEQLVQKRRPVYKPVLAAVNGYALGGGMELLQCTDIRIAASHAEFGLPEPSRGIVPGAGSMVRLPRQLPWAWAMEVLLTGRRFSAEEAFRMGIVNRVVERDQLMDATLEVAERVAANAPLALEAIKRTALVTANLPWDEAFAIEAESSGRVMRSHDAIEGPRAFAEKRKPRFEGR
jgi:enoyl-CoA hydratase